MKSLKFGKGPDDNNRNSDNKSRFNKKGIVLTAILVLGIVAASFLVWLLPTGTNPGVVKSNMTVTFVDSNVTLTSVKSQYALLKEEVQNQVNSLDTNQTQNISSINSFLTTSLSQNEDLMRALLEGHPDQSMLPEYLSLMNEMKNYSMYLTDLKNTTLN